ncbi:unnamed protein product [Periconia digitata]|uniref:O-methyltransferase domain-containing protein n=1 Tax=Periconia digitata TaxID=1303443 RepID=A0A9W4XX38_9PLEO|nr:unnamed protein product [Periconia digitata]
MNTCICVANSHSSTSMEQVLTKVNGALGEAIDALSGPLQATRLSTLQASDFSLPDKESSELATRTIDLADRLLRLVQPPATQLAESFLAYLDTKCLCAAVEHGIPDLLAAGPQTLDELAAHSALQPLRLKQIMPVLYNNGIFTYDAGTSRYANNASSTLLLSEHWTQWHRWVSLYGNEFYDFAARIPAAIRAGETRSAAQMTEGIASDQNLFAYYAQQPGMQEKFHGALGASAVAQSPGLLADYAWAELGDATVLDIGGGGGSFIHSLLRAHGELRGALLELASVVDLVWPKFFAHGGEFADVASRMTALHVGDFLHAVPEYEIYTMKWCLHNWGDEDVMRILRVVRKAIRVTPRARMIIIESVLDDGRSSRIWRYGNVTMMSAVNGQERTVAEWRDLAGRTAWKVAAVVDMRNVWAKAIELRPDTVALSNTVNGNIH